MNNILPVVKWAGGKRWLIKKHASYFPTNIDRLVEPFLGGASVFLNLSSKKALLCDANKELITTYRAIRDHWKEVEHGLRVMQDLHCKEFYYSTRMEEPQDSICKAIRFLYLNRTCWNGLYRVNKKGAFNVPIGTKSTVLLPNDDFEGFSKLLKRKGVSLNAQDFRKTFAKISPSDFIYIDPPYTVKHNQNGFLKYNESIFSWEDQIALRNMVENAAIIGCKLLISQANHQSIRELYSDLGEIKTVSRHSILASKSDFRKSVDEILISVNF